MQTAMGQVSLCICAVCGGLPEPLLFAHVSGRPSGNFNQRTRHVALLKVWACALKVQSLTESPESLFLAMQLIYKKVNKISYKLIDLKTALLKFPRIS